MIIWKFVDYVTDAETVPLDEWVANYLTLAEKAEFDAAVDYLQRIEDWDTVRRAKQKYKELQRELVGLTELKFSRTTQAMGRNFKTHFRPVGILKREQRLFIFLGGFKKGNPGPIPLDAYTKALRYKKEYEEDRGTTREHKT
jgi:hypothetical protein